MQRGSADEIRGREGKQGADGRAAKGEVEPQMEMEVKERKHGGLG